MYQIAYKPLKTVWLKAAVMGSLWASFEILVGSFLHNLHVPFSGTILTFSSVFIIIAYIQFWNDKGLVWRAGLICALMKSISPSAVILGPMIGILTEALIIELFLRLGGRNLVSYMFAGGVVVLSALLHKVVSLLILYGTDLIRIFQGLVQFAVKQLNVTGIDPRTLVLLLMLIYFFTGIVAAVLGYFSGKKYKDKSWNTVTNETVPMEFKSKMFQISEKHRYSVILLFVHLAAIITCMWLITVQPYYIYLPSCIAYLISCFTWYKKSLRYLKKVAFWIQFMIITFLAAFLFEGYSSGQFLSQQGLIIGLKMNLRAFIIMAGFGAIAVELKNPLIRSILYNRGFSSLYHSLSLSFSALPGIIAGFPKTRELMDKGSSLLLYLFSQSQILMEQFRSEFSKRPPVIIITGDVGQGKTSFIRDLTRKLISQDIKVFGFFSVGIHENSERIGFDLEDIMTGQRSVISRKNGFDGWIRHGHYSFDPIVFESESERLWKQSGQGAELLIIDEVGPLELNDSGWHRLIEMFCRQQPIPMIWIVRKKLAQKAARKWNVGNVHIFTLGEDDAVDLASLIKTITGK